jgi:hypothetical protein
MTQLLVYKHLIQWLPKEYKMFVYHSCLLYLHIKINLHKWIGLGIFNNKTTYIKFSIFIPNNEIELSKIFDAEFFVILVFNGVF